MAEFYHGARADKVWRNEEETAFSLAASAQLRLAFDLAVWTGQRQADLLALTWTAYDGEKIRLRQKKTNVYVVVPLFSELKARFDATPCLRGHDPDDAGRPTVDAG